jgi:hypothetical protein
MDRLPLPLALLCLALGGCAGPPVPTPVQDEPVCRDFELGPTKTKMQGGLRYPVELKILEGKTLVMRQTIYGLRSEKDVRSRILVPDDNAEYKLQWGQCSNERAPRPVPPPHDGKDAHEARDTAHYECGDPTVYKTDPLVTKKHDLASHAVTYAPPPRPECWTSEVPPAPAAPPSPAPAPAGSGAPDAAAVPPPAAPPASAGAAPSAAPDAGSKK